jgi:PBSX family phage portal protein
MAIKKVEEQDENEFDIDAYLDTAEVVHIASGDEFDVDLSKVKTSMPANIKRRATTISKKFESTKGDVASKRIDVLSPTAYSLFDVARPPYNFQMLASIYEQNQWQNGAVDAKTYNTVALGYNFVPTPATIQKLDMLEGKKDALDKFRRKLEKLRQDHNLWLDSLNAEDTITEILIKLGKDYESTGNAYLEVGRTSSGVIAYIGHIPATTMRVRQARDGFVQMVNTNKVAFFRNFNDAETVDPINGDESPHEVIHFKKYTPNSDYYGAPDIISAIGAVLGSRFATTFNLDYFENKAVPRHIVVVKGATLSTQAENALYEFFNVKLKGKNHRTLYIPLPADDPDRKVEFKIEPVEAGIQDASFVKYEDGNRDKVLAANRTPISKIMLAPGVSLAASRDADKTFKEQVTRPTQAIFEKRINMIVAEKSDVFLFKLNELSLTDEDTQSKIDERYLRMQVIVPNEVRARMGLPGIDGGDKVVDLKPQQAADAKSNATGNDARARERANGATDSAGEARNPKGEGRSSE